MRFINYIFRSRSTTGRCIRTFIFLALFVTLTYHFIFFRLTDLWKNSISNVSRKTWLSIRDVSNLSRPACVFPKLEINNANIMKFFVKHPRLHCNTESDWLIISSGTFIITDEAYRKHPDIQCDAYPIVKVSDFSVREDAAIQDVKNGTPILNDFYRVYCKSSDMSEYNNYLAGISLNPDVLKRNKANNASKGLDLDVIIIGLDSTSHLAWHRHLPLTTEYFLNKLNGTEMEGYNILGDGTPAALMPILLGHLEEELHEARRGFGGASTVDDFPWIWKDFRDAGYVVTYAEDDAYLGTFQYRLLGFKNQPTDHYFRYFCVAAEPNYGRFQKHCQGSRPRHSVVLDYTYQLFSVYKQRRHWVFTFQSQLSHQDNNNLSLMDEDLLQHLQRLHEEKILDNAILVMMADHGGRFSKVRATEQGKQEERLPYFALRFPEWFHEKYPDVIKNVKINSQRLTTPFDVYETFKEILHFTGTGKADISKRGVSMFKEIPLERDCERAHVDPHWCSCLDWKKEDPHSDVVTKAMSAVLSTLNNFTAAYRDLCSVLVLDEVISVSSFKVKDAVLKFKDTNDGGRGRFGSMTDNTQHSVVLYQVTLVTRPGSGRFEVTVSYDLQNKVFTMSPKDISRTNKYGNSPWCVEKQDSFLRPYCFCKDLLEPNSLVGNLTAKQTAVSL